jgi:hypothetical protein
MVEMYLDENETIGGARTRDGIATKRRKSHKREKPFPILSSMRSFAAKLRIPHSEFVTFSLGVTASDAYLRLMTAFSPRGWHRHVRLSAQMCVNVRLMTLFSERAGSEALLRREAHVFQSPDRTRVRMSQNHPRKPEFQLIPAYSCLIPPSNPGGGGSA